MTRRHVSLESVMDDDEEEPIRCYRNLTPEGICFCQRHENAKVKSVCKKCSIIQSVIGLNPL